MKKMKKWSFIITIIQGVVIWFFYRKAKKRKTHCYELSMSGFQSQQFYNLVCEWLGQKQQNKPITDYFKKHNIKKIAIYGMGNLGWLLYEDLKDSEIDIVCAYDRNAAIMANPIETKSPKEMQDGVEAVDAIVVTTIGIFYDICNYITQYTDIPVLSLEDVIYSR